MKEAENLSLLSAEGTKKANSAFYGLELLFIQKTCTYLTDAGTHYSS